MPEGIPLLEQSVRICVSALKLGTMATDTVSAGPASFESV